MPSRYHKPNHWPTKTIRLLAIKISRYRTFEVTAIGVVCMIVYHIEHYPYTSFVQCLYHLLKLADADSRIVRIGSIRTIGYIVILRIISPIILVLDPAWFRLPKHNHKTEANGRVLLPARSDDRFRSAIWQSSSYHVLSMPKIFPYG